MTRTQIQLPDELYQSARAVAKRREISLAELVRRGLEYMISVTPDQSSTEETWKLPAPLDLGVTPSLEDTD